MAEEQAINRSLQNCIQGRVQWNGTLRLVHEAGLHSQILKAFKVAHRAWDFTREMVAGEVKCLELC